MIQTGFEQNWKKKVLRFRDPPKVKPFLPFAVSETSRARAMRCCYTFHTLYSPFTTWIKWRAKEVEKKVKTTTTSTLFLELESVSETEVGHLKSYVPVKAVFLWIDWRSPSSSSLFQTLVKKVIFPDRFINYSTHVNSWLQSIRHPSHHHRRRHLEEFQTLSYLSSLKLWCG